MAQSLTLTAVDPQKRTTAVETITAAGAGSPVQCCGDIALQVTGVATAVTGKVQRSTVNPLSGTPNWVTVTTADMTGNPSTGTVAVQGFVEPAMAWYRFVVSAITGASVDVTFSTSRVKS